MFVLDPILAKDTHYIKSLELSDILLMNDNRFPWIILVPRRENISEIFDLTEFDQRVLWQEITLVSRWSKIHFKADKMNVAALGNVVSQLHVHIIARKITDAAWPKPVWGQTTAIPYSAEELNILTRKVSTFL